MSLCQLTISELPAKSSDLALWQGYLCVGYSDRYDRFGRSEDLDAGLRWALAAIKSSGQDPVRLASRQQQLGIAYRNKFSHTNELQYMDQALYWTEASISKTPPTEKITLAIRRFNLANLYSARYDVKHHIEDLHVSIDLAQQASAMLPENHPHLHEGCHNLSSFLQQKYDRLGDPWDLDEAIRLARKALDNASEATPNRAAYADHFAAVVYLRYRLLGNLDDLESAIEWSEVAIAKTKDDHPRLALHQYNFAVIIYERFIRHRNRNDLDLAFHTCRSAIALTPTHDPKHPMRQLFLANLYKALFRHVSKNPIDLESSIRLHEPIIELTPPSHPLAAERYSSLASTHADFYTWIGGIEHRTAAMKWNRAALEASRSDDPLRHLYCNRLAIQYHNSYTCLRQVDDLNISLKFSDEALKCLPANHPREANYKRLLAEAYAAKYNLMHDTVDRDRALEYFRSAAYTPNSNPSHLWKAVEGWVHFSELSRLSDESVTAYSAVYHILPELFWLGSDIKSKHETLRQYDVAGVTINAIAACVECHDLERAVEFLEQSLSLTLQQLLELQNDLSILREQFPSYASTLEDLSFELRKIASSSHDLDHDKRGDWNMQRKLTIERGALLKTVRQLPGFDDFLLPATFHSLVAAADFGPIIILNCSSKRCDAIIMFPGGQLVHVGIPKVDSEAVTKHYDLLRSALRRFGIHSRETRDMDGEHRAGRPMPRRGDDGETAMNTVLSWIWTYIVSVVFQTLQAHGVTAGRVWWCLTGPLTYLPFHAAGPPNDYIQSYTSTLGALIRARSSPQPASPAKIMAIGVSDTKAHWLARLPSVTQEIEALTQTASKARVSAIMNADATFQNIIKVLPNASWLHLACHGKQGNAREPLTSGLMLYDDTKLELATIINMSIPNASFVFLSACETAMGDVDMVSESLHLAGGMIFAGFKAVIGTLWTIKDADGPEVAQAVYSHIFRDGGEPNITDTAEALHIAVQHLRKRGISPHRWAPFIHIGV